MVISQSTIKNNQLKLLEYGSEYYESSISEGFGVVVDCCCCVLPTFVVYLSLDLPMSVISDLWPHSMLSRIKECHKMIISVPILFPHPSLGTTDKPRAGTTFSQILQFYLFFADNEATDLKKPSKKGGLAK